jgi:hypothetical protein
MQRHLQRQRRQVMHRVLASMVLALLASLAPARAEAAKVVILRPAGATPALKETLSRLQGEVLSLGLEVSIVERPATPYTTATESRARMERMAVERDSDAVMDVIGDATPAAVDILVLEGRARRSEIARVALEPDADNAPERLAIRAVDALRARLVELDLLAKGDATPVRAPPAAVATAPSRDAPDRRGRIDLEAGAAMLTSIDGVGPALMPLVRFGWEVRAPLVLRGELAGFGSRPSVAAATGAARVAQQYAVLGACYCGGAARTVQPAFALSAGVLRTAIDGEADVPSAAHAVERWSFLLDGSVGARVNLPGRTHLTLAAHVQVAEPYIAIHIVDTVVATTGRPNVLLTLTVGAWL